MHLRRQLVLGLPLGQCGDCCFLCSGSRLSASVGVAGSVRCDGMLVCVCVLGSGRLVGGARVGTGQGSRCSGHVLGFCVGFPRLVVGLCASAPGEPTPSMHVPGIFGAPSSAAGGMCLCFGLDSRCVGNCCGWLHTLLLRVFFNRPARRHSPRPIAGSISCTSSVESATMLLTGFEQCGVQVPARIFPAIARAHRKFVCPLPW